MNNFFLDKLRYNAYIFGDRNAVVFRTEYISYRELDEETTKLADSLRRIISRQQMPIIIYHTRGIEFIKYMIAVIKCNCFYIPLEEVCPVNRVEMIYRDIGAEIVISDILNNDSGMKVFNCKEYKKQLYENTEEVATAYDDKNILYVMYTSGTTGRPKGIAIKNENVKNLIETFGGIIYDSINENINVGLIASFSFDTSVKQIYCALYYAKTLVIADDTVRNFGRKIHDFHNNNQLTICDATPSHLKLMLIQKPKKTSKLPILFIGGENLQWDLLNEYREKINGQCRFVNLYGPTECCVDVSYNYIDKIDQIHGSVPIGKAFNNTTLILQDEEGQVITKENMIGELVVYGKQVGYGYVGNNISNGFIYNNGVTIGYRTGDLGKYDDKHDIVILSRKDRQVKVNGYRIELGEIESRISEFCGTQCVVSCANNGKKASIVAFIVKGNEKKSKEELKEHLVKSLMPYMLPREYIYLNSFPLNVNGKIDENLLWEMYRKVKMINQ